MKVIIDGVFFGMGRSGIARVWREAIRRLASRPQLEIVLLDRGGLHDPFDGVTIIPFPSYTLRNTAQDSALLQQICDFYQADLFVSTYYTTPLTTPTIAVVHDMIPERLGWDLHEPVWQEKELCLSHALRHVCVSANTRRDLLASYPELAESKVTVAHLGVDDSVFRPREAEEVAAFRDRLQLDRDYFIINGSSRSPDYKDISLVLEALNTVREPDFDLLFTGAGATTVEYVDGRQHITAFLTDDELAIAYAGAAALVYPSKYEGFGLPVIEAMSSGCPVICTRSGSLGEICGGAALHVTGRDSQELGDAMCLVRRPAVRLAMTRLGHQHAAIYRWEHFVDRLHESMLEAVHEGYEEATRTFYTGWAALRDVQGQVDAVRP